MDKLFVKAKPTTGNQTERFVNISLTNEIHRETERYTFGITYGGNHTNYYIDDKNEIKRVDKLLSL
ncbi:hypothetical protein RI065_04310 [Mycoplasmatota bacterium zrk1]